MHARIGLSPQIVICLQQDLEKASKVFFAELRRRVRERGLLIRRGGNQIRIPAANARNQQIAYVPDGFAAEMLKVAAVLLKGVHEAEGAVRRAFRDGGNQFVERIFRHNAQKFAHLFIRNDVAAISSRLFQQGKRVAQTAFRHSRNDRHGSRLDFQIFFFRDLFQAPGNFGEG